MPHIHCNHIHEDNYCNHISHAQSLQHFNNKSELSTIVAELLAKIAKEKKITKVYFDRGIYKYHGRVKIFAETLRKNGMEF